MADKFQHTAGFGSLFKNDKKDNDKQPDYRGTGCTEEGVVIEIAGWKKQGAKGEYLSLKISKEYVPGEKKAAPAATANSNFNQDELNNIPF
jgi:uncharacterized protein (DUF736 family)